MKAEAAILTQDPSRTGELAARLEQQGFDTAVGFEGPRDPFLPMLLAAQATSRIGLATGVAIAFARNPMICAQIANDLQQLSGGRFVLGLGTQIKPHIEKRFSQPWSRPAARMREFVQAIRAIWSCWNEGTKLDFRGEFYTHTLMTPVFDPGPNPFGPPPIFLAGVGPRMVEVCGEVADGFFVHPLHTPEYLRATTLPALERGLERGGRRREDIEVSCQTITLIGTNDEQLLSARSKAKAQISFYGSTPAYAGVLEHHGRADLHQQLNRLSKQGKWLEMIALVDDDLLDAIAVGGTPAEAGRRLRARNEGFAERTMLTLYDETGDPDAVTDVVRALKEG